MCFGFHVEYSLCLPVLMKLEFSRPIFKKKSCVKFHGNPSGGSRVFPWGRTDMTKLIVDFLNFANAPKECARTSARALGSCSISMFT